MQAKPFEFIAKHKVPFMIAGGAVVILLIYKNMSGAGTTTTQTAPTQSTVDPTAQQIALIGAQSGAALQLQQDKEAFSLAMGSQTGTTQTTQQTNELAAQLALAGIQAKQASDQTAASLALGQAETQANVQIQGILAGENLGIAQVNGQTQQVISTNQTNASIAQSNANAAVGEANANAIASSGGNSTSSIISSVGMMAAMFL